MSEAIRWVSAAVAGLALFGLPFVPYTFGGHVHATGPHSDHGARHGGQLVMVGDYHLELVERTESVELYLSNSTRQPLRPASCQVTFDEGPPVICEWKGYRSVAPKPPRAASGLYELLVVGGPPLTIEFPTAVHRRLTAWFVLP